MPASATAPQPKNLESRKLELLVRIAQIDDESMIDLLEDIVSEEDEKQAVLTEEEIELVEKRLRDFKSHPGEFVTLEQLASKIKNRQ